MFVVHSPINQILHQVKAEYDWGEARLEAIEELTGSKVRHPPTRPPTHPPTHLPHPPPHSNPVRLLHPSPLMYHSTSFEPHVLPPTTHPPTSPTIQELPLVYVGGQLIGGAEKVQAKVADGSLKKTVSTLRQVHWFNR